MRPTALVWLTSLLIGCSNPCQDLCSMMADLSESCGNTVSDAEIAACEESFADADPDQLQTCRDFGHPEVLANEWTCDDVNLFR
ncbi:MAG TPA: hypothetical protein PKA64_22650 [Myxococcota bacterium]|nr:hypothetical protein [Myxococcota bacterium]